ncbi:hypothetical protein LSTR_LSTR001408 [Laodelphax striatellus]|uniref:Odorant receptor n=1 Tax=Laodelphax striatellus TaxID=195883 RepID=A0A482XA72_LAOST|nr:hypothetical protein LSTR_LSTR001408 [Laodelphax striatellus]
MKNTKKKTQGYWNEKQPERFLIIRNVVNMTNYLNSSEYYVFLRYLTDVVIVYNVINLSFAISHFWNDNHKKLLAVKELNVSFYAVCLRMTTKEVLPLCELVESFCADKITFYLNDRSEKQKKIRDARIGRLKNLDKMNIRYTVVLIFFSVIVPLLQSVYTVFISGKYYDIQDLQPILFSYYPEDYKSLKMHFTVQAFIGIFLIVEELQMYCIFTAVYMASYTLTDEFDLLFTCLEEIDQNIRDFSHVKRSIKLDTTYERYKSTYENQLFVFLAKIVDHHSSIYSNVELLSRRIGSLCLGTINAWTFQLFVCVMLVYINKDTATRIKFVFLALAIVVLMIMCASIGQTISDKGEKLRKTLWECSWVDKPEWFKKAILVMMKRSTRPLEIRPFGLYVLDLRRFAVILNGMYSYFNVVYN